MKSVTVVLAPSITGYPHQGVIWRPDQWILLASGQVADLTAGEDAES